MQVLVCIAAMQISSIQEDNVRKVILWLIQHFCGDQSLLCLSLAVEIDFNCVVK